MTTPNPIDLDLLDRYLAGESSPAEAARVRLAADGDTRVRDLIAELPAATRAQDAISWDVDRAWAQQQQAGTPVSGTSPRTIRASGTRTIPWLRLAAVLVVGLALAFVFRSYTRQSRPATSVASASYSAPPAAPRPVTLADGSTVTLAPHSTLTVPASFPASGRDVYLDGEAFFEVTHDRARPYVVHARGSLIQVLGTGFNVSAYADTSNIEVVVATGRVQLTAPATRSNRVLSPGELGRLDASGAISVEPVDVEAYTSWRRGLTFSAIRFEDALPRLERWFGVNIEIADRALAEKRLTAFFQQQDLTDVLDALATTLNARYERSPNGIVFHSIN